MIEPIEVLVYRGGLVESRHMVHAALCDARGNVLAAAGRPEIVTYWRSSAKPIQALPLIAAGGVEAFGLSPADIAVMCASHEGEPFHVEQVLQILRKAGFDVSALKCGAHPPAHGPSARALAMRGEAPGPLHNNCSGKHAGMLAHAKLIGADPNSYPDPAHPVQQRILDAVSEFTGAARGEIRIGVDGCGVPVFGLPLSRMATAFARLASGEGVSEEHAAAARVVVSSMQAHPEMVSGTEGFCTRLMAQLAPAIVAKGGAEGVYCLGHTSGRWGLAVKVEDGAGRARPPVVVSILKELGVWKAEAAEELERYRRPEVRNHAGTVVGSIESSLPESFVDALHRLREGAAHA